MAYVLVWKLGHKWEGKKPYVELHRKFTGFGDARERRRGARRLRRRRNQPLTSISRKKLLYEYGKLLTL